jgi:hypothetical protein
MTFELLDANELNALILSFASKNSAESWFLAIASLMIVIAFFCLPF